MTRFRSPFRRLLHWGPIAVLFIVKLITWAMIHVMGMWWPPHLSAGGAVHSAVFLGLAASTLYYFLQSLLEGPGFVPLGWKPENEDDKQYLQYCTLCKGYKAPRSHHCRKCGYCVLKMDHHCPWINSCVGHANHSYFVLFMTAAVLGCLHASIVLPMCVYHAFNRSYFVSYGTGREPVVYLTLTTLLLVLLAIGLAVGVVLALGALLFFQLRSILRNQTTIEDWILEKAAARREVQSLPPFTFPYNLGWKENVKLVVWGSRYSGLKWPVRDGCGQYDLTVEQLVQKSEKQSRSRLYSATQHYDGRWVPILSRPRAAINAPFFDVARLPLTPGDLIKATRQRKHWLFGEKLVPNARGPRGWFPSAAAVRTDAHTHTHTHTD